MNDGSQNMEEKSLPQKSEKKELPPILDDHPIFKGGERYNFTLSKEVTCKNSHDFVRISGIEAKCKRCPVGTMITPANEVKNGHIYLHGSLLI